MQPDRLRVLITGGSGGLGGLIAEQFAALGAEITVMDRTAPTTPGVAFVACDLGSSPGVEAAAGAAVALSPNILINLAGIQWFGPVEDQPAEHLYASYMVNLVAPARLIQAVLPGMKARGSGHIVNVGSIFGSINFAHFATYSSSKAGLRGLSQALRRELADTGIGVTYVAPRAVRTPLNSPLVLRYAKLTGMNMDAPEATANRIVDAILSKANEAYIGFPESAFVRINALFPGLVDRVLKGGDRKARKLFSQSTS